MNLILPLLSDKMLNWLLNVFYYSFCSTNTSAFSLSLVLSSFSMLWCTFSSIITYKLEHFTKKIESISFHVRYYYEGLNIMLKEGKSKQTTVNNNNNNKNARKNRNTRIMSWSKNLSIYNNQRKAEKRSLIEKCEFIYVKTEYTNRTIIYLHGILRKTNGKKGKSFLRK